MSEDPYDEGITFASRGLVEDGLRWRAANPKASTTHQLHPGDLRAKLSEAGRWVHDQLQRYRYKPNVEWEVLQPDSGPRRTYHEFGMDAVFVRITMWVLDSRGGKRVMPITSRRLVDQYATEDRNGERFMYWLRESLQDLEMHEFGEWFRRDGALVNDPHARPSPIGPIHQ